MRCACKSLALGFVTGSSLTSALGGGDAIYDSGSDLIELSDGAAIGKTCLPVTAEGEIWTTGFLADQVNKIADGYWAFAFGGNGIFAGHKVPKCQCAGAAFPGGVSLVPMMISDGFGEELIARRIRELNVGQ